MLPAALPRTAPHADPAPSASELASILWAGQRAPSGDNSQPWRLRVRGAEVEISLDTERARCGHFGEVAGLMSLGAVMESMAIAAADLGLRTTAARSTAGASPSFVVRIFRAPTPVSDLGAAIGARCTNRAPFHDAPLPDATLEALASEGTANVPVVLTSDVRRREAVAVAADVAEQVRFAEVPMEDFHRWLRFSSSDALQTKDGLDVRLLCLRASERLALRICGSRAGTSALRALGGSTLAGRRAGADILASGGLGLIAQPALTEAAFVASGRVMLRVWLRATRLGLAFAPATAAALVPLSRYFGAAFRPDHDAALDDADRTLRDVFGVPAGHHPVFLFRVGSPEHLPTIRSERRDPTPEHVQGPQR